MAMSINKTTNKINYLKGKISECEQQLTQTTYTSLFALKSKINSYKIHLLREERYLLFLTHINRNNATESKNS